MTIDDCSPNITVYYFGCWDRPGHFLHDRTGRAIYRSYGNGLKIPMDERHLDGLFAPPFVNEREDVAALTHIHNWTVLAMWDRSVDTRGACNAAFLVPGIKTEAEMWALARQHYPKIVARLKAAPK